MENVNKRKYINVALLICIILLIQNLPFNLFIKNRIYIAGIKIGFSIISLAYYFFYIKKEGLIKPKVFKACYKDLMFLPLLLLPLSNIIASLISGYERIDLDIGYLIISFFNVLLLVIVEELLFRSLLLGEMKNDTSRLKALIYSSLIFAAMHLLNINSIASIPYCLIQALYTGGLGMLLGLAYIKSNNIIIPIIAHFLFNYINDTLASNLFILEWDYIFFIVNIIFAVVFTIYFILVYFFYKERDYAS